jgi:hypothetical protein
MVVARTVLARQMAVPLSVSAPSRHTPSALEEWEGGGRWMD